MDFETEKLELVGASFERLAGGVENLIFSGGHASTDYVNMAASITFSP